MLNPSPRLGSASSMTRSNSITLKSSGQLAATFSPRRDASSVQVQADVNRQVAQWDSEMDSLDRKQEQLVGEQWKLMRTQISSLMCALADMRTDLANLKDNIASKEVEKEVEKLLAGHDRFGRNQTATDERVSYLESFFGESADKHAAELARHKDDALEHKTTMESRLESLESLIGDSSKKHSQELELQFGKLQELARDVQSALAKCAPSEHLVSCAKRVDYLEKFLGESADTHNEHKSTVEARLQYLETLIGDSSEKHAKEISGAMSSLGDLQKAIASCAKSDHHSSLEERIKYLEKFTGESADSHNDHKTSIESRLEYIEALIGDSSDKHAKELATAKDSLSDLHKVIETCAKADHHSSLEQRLNYLEKFLGESADKHEKNEKASEVHKESMETRLKYIEQLIGDNADKHAKALDEARLKLGNLDSAVSFCATSEHHSSLEQRLGELEKSVFAECKQLCSNLDDFKSSSAKRFKDLDSSFSVSAEKNSYGLQQLEARLGECGKADHGAALENRVNYLEKLLGESHSNHTSHKASIETRLEFIESSIGDSAERHAKEIAEAQDKLHDLHRAVSTCAKMEHHASVQSRLEYIEKFMGESADKHQQAVLNLETAHANSRDLHNKIAGEIDTRNQFYSLLEERVSGHERKLADVVETNSRKLSTLEQAHVKFKASLDDLSGVVRGEKSIRETMHAKFEERVLQMESFFGGNFDRYVKELEAIQTRIREMQSRSDQSKSAVDSYRAAVDQRLHMLEASIHESSNAKTGELTKDLEQRLFCMQEDQKRARDVLESSLQEQIQLERSARDSQLVLMKETWDREYNHKNTDNAMLKQFVYNELASERSMRESSEQVLERRMEGREQALERRMEGRIEVCERNVAGEARRLWLAMEGEARRHDELIKKEEPKPVLSPVLSPRTYVVKPPMPQVTRMISTGSACSSTTLGMPVSGAPVGSPGTSLPGNSVMLSMASGGHVERRDEAAQTPRTSLSDQQPTPRAPNHTTRSSPASATRTPVSVTRDIRIETANDISANFAANVTHKAKEKAPRHHEKSKPGSDKSKGGRFDIL